VFFTQTLNCETCEPTKQILGELAELSGQISVEERNFLLEGDLAAGYGIDRAPAIAVVARRTTGSVFSHSVGLRVHVAARRHPTGVGRRFRLSEASRALLAGLESPLALEVFVTPT